MSEQIKKALAAPDSGKPSLEEFKVMVYKDRERRRRKRRAAAACVAVILIAGFFTFDYLVPEVGADKNPKEEIITEDGVIIEDGGWGSSEEEDNVWVTEDWEQVEDAKELFPVLLIPKYIPEGYVFTKLKIDNFIRNDITAEYSFVCGNDAIFIEISFTENDSISLEVEDVSKEIISKKGKVFLQEKIKTATIQFDDGNIIVVNGDLSEIEIIRIIEGLDL